MSLWKCTNFSFCISEHKMNIVINHCKYRSFDHTESRNYRYFAFKLCVLEKIAINYFLLHYSFEFTAKLWSVKNKNNNCCQLWILISEHHKELQCGLTCYRLYLKELTDLRKIHDPFASLCATFALGSLELQVLKTLTPTKSLSISMTLDAKKNSCKS